MLRLPALKFPTPTELFSTPSELEPRKTYSATQVIPARYAPFGGGGAAT